MGVGVVAPKAVLASDTMQPWACFGGLQGACYGQIATQLFKSKHRFKNLCSCLLQQDTVSVTNLVGYVREKKRVVGRVWQKTKRKLRNRFKKKRVRGAKIKRNLSKPRY